VSTDMNMLKKMMLASVLAALVAFAAPAAASAHLQWYESGFPDLLLEGETELHLVGALATSIPSTEFIEELCPVTFSAVASNSGSEGEARGVITAGKFNGGGECATNLSFAGCNLTEVGVNFGEIAWTLTTVTPDQVAVHYLTFIRHYSAACQIFGIPSRLPTAGSLKGTLTSNAGPEGEDCISFEEAEGLAVEGGGPVVTVDGELCISLPLTLH